MKSILISIKPQWVAKILNGEKTIEVRKSKPKCDLPIDVYIYCTKDNFKGIKDNRELNYRSKVVAKFTLNKAEEIKHDNNGSFYYPYGHIRFMTDTLNEHHLLGKSCLLFGELGEYLYPNNYKGYAWHISNLVVFDRPRELGEFNKVGWKKWCAEHPPILSLFQPKKCYEELKQFVITKAPQSWQFIEVEGDK